MGRLLVVLAVAIGGAGCARNCTPTAGLQPAKLVDLSAGPDDHAPVPPGPLKQVEAEFLRRGAAAHPPGARPYHFLALSGGGFFGAYGIGVLNGWTEAGCRPEFDAVTGISTGSLFATYAFLGPGYDAVARDAMVGVEVDELLRRRRVPGALARGALFDPAGLVRAIDRYVTPDILCRVAAEHARGRRLYVGTTNLDTRGLIIWDLGAIAARGTPADLQLYKDVLLASCAVPGALPPVRFPVAVDGRPYEELHVDGGVSDTVLFRAFMVADRNRQFGVPGATAPPGSTVWVVNNGKLYAEPSCVKPNIVQVLFASYRSLIYGKNRDEMHRLYLNGLETGVGFRLAAIPRDFPLGDEGALSLSAEDQWKLYEEGRRHGRQAGAGPDWRDLPPGTDPAEQALPRSGTRFATRPPADEPGTGPAYPAASAASPSPVSR